MTFDPFDPAQHAEALEKAILPRYRHDCDQCTFLGHCNNFDLYCCPQSGLGRTMVARWGDHPYENKSGMAAADGRDFELTVAKQTAIAKGLMK